MRYLVTGGSGFIGSHLASMLASPANEVHFIDNLSDYYAPYLKELRTNWVLSHPNTKFHNIDLAERAITQEFFKYFTFDTVFHLAGQPGVRMSREDSYKYTASNLVAFENVLSSVISLGIPNFLYASSSSVYGNSKKNLFTENDKNILPISYYGATKLANEFAAAAMVRGTDTKARGLRFFTVYGPWGRPDMAYFRLINSALNGSQFELYGNGEALRDFTYVGDIIKSMRMLELELITHNPGFSDVVNIGGGRPVSMAALISKIENITGQKIDVIKKSIHQNDVHKTMADTSKLRRLTEQSPETSIERGLGDTIQWAQKTEIIGKLSRWIESVPDVQ